LGRLSPLQPTQPFSTSRPCLWFGADNRALLGSRANAYSCAPVTAPRGPSASYDTATARWPCAFDKTDPPVIPSFCPSTNDARSAASSFPRFPAPVAHVSDSTGTGGIKAHLAASPSPESKPLAPYRVQFIARSGGAKYDHRQRPLDAVVGASTWGWGIVWDLWERVRGLGGCCCTSWLGGFIVVAASPSCAVDRAERHSDSGKNLTNAFAMLSYSFSSIPSEGRELGALMVESRRWRRLVELPRWPELGECSWVNACAIGYSIDGSDLIRIPLRMRGIRTVRLNTMAGCGSRFIKFLPFSPDPTIPDVYRFVALVI
jgi:hypothetical protein